MTTHTLTERYLAAAAARVPEAEREEFRAELAERIADTVDAKLAAGLDPAAAEHATLTELGDPEALTATYTGRPLHLIGPRFYLAWRYLMRLLLPIVTIATAGAITIANVADSTGSTAGSAQEAIGKIIGDAIGTAVSTGVWLAFWLTVVFAVIERLPAAEKTRREVANGLRWKPERLPEIADASSRGFRKDQVASIVWLSILGVLVLVAHRVTFISDGVTERVSLFQPETWQWMRWALLAIIAVDLALAVVLLVRRRRTWTLAFLNLATGIAFAAVMLPPLFQERLVNPAIFDAADWSTGAAQFRDGGIGVVLTALVVLAIAFIDPIETFYKTWRERSSVAVAH